MPGPIHRCLARDHARLDELLRRAVARADAIDMEAYGRFREGLLRHIAMEEKVLLPEAKRARGGEALPIAPRLRADHAALAALLVPPPTREVLATIQRILAEHNPLEEDPGGLYDVCDELVGEGADEVVARIEAVPPVPVAANLDSPRVRAHIAGLLRTRGG